jgi:AcrR family transcriptional regulator
MKRSRNTASPTPDRRPPDRRVARTRRQLRDALVSLVIERTWDSVSVRDVCERADIGRSTFYVHFADKEELMLSGFQTLEATLESVRRTAPGQFAFARELIVHTQENLPLFRALVATKTGRHVIGHLRGVSTRLVTAELRALRLTGTRQAQLAQYIAGGLVEMLVTWLEGPPRRSANELAETFLELTRKLLA